MLIIGEKINSSIPAIRELIKNKDRAAIQDLAVRQAEAGAAYLDLNAAMGDEVADLEWLVRTVQEVTDTPLCLDSTSAAAIQKGLETVRGPVMVNSISLETNRIEKMLPLVIDCNCPVIGLTIDDNGIPKTAAERISLAEKLVEILSKKNYNLDQLYIDPLVLPLSVSHENALMFFECLTTIKERFKVKTVSGLSNISYNMPKRKLINRYFLTVCMAHGMDAAILDPLDQQIMTAVMTTELLLGRDRFGRKYLQAYRSGSLA